MSCQHPFYFFTFCRDTPARKTYNYKPSNHISPTTIPAPSFLLPWPHYFTSIPPLQSIFPITAYTIPLSFLSLSSSFFTTSPLWPSVVIFRLSPFYHLHAPILVILSSLLFYAHSLSLYLLLCNSLVLSHVTLSIWLKYSSSPSNTFPLRSSLSFYSDFLHLTIPLFHPHLHFSFPLIPFPYSISLFRVTPPIYKQRDMSSYFYLIFKELQIVYFLVFRTETDCLQTYVLTQCTHIVFKYYACSRCICDSHHMLLYRHRLLIYLKQNNKSRMLPEYKFNRFLTLICFFIFY